MFENCKATRRLTLIMDDRRRNGKNPSEIAPGLAGRAAGNGNKTIDYLVTYAFPPICPIPARILHDSFIERLSEQSHLPEGEGT
jgi:hypothetical protein